MGLIEGKRKAPQAGQDPGGDAGSLTRRPLSIRRLWCFSVRVARNPWTRVVVLILLTMFQMLLVWLVGELIDLSISLMELWAELARKHLEITLDSSS